MGMDCIEMKSVKVPWYMDVEVDDRFSSSS